ncbi:MAG: hypothetical protein JSV99_09925 [Planctomycetota bacterium]|nr:MAG: hypothetical protein JSV99_09925 [Planctomycetota bacterium]
MEKDMEKEKIEIMVICDDERHLNELTSDINRRLAEIASAIGRRGAEITVVSFARTSDLNGTTAFNVENLKVIVLSCAGRADPPYDLWVLRHRFPRASRVGELDIDTQERAYHMIDCWGADDIFSKGEDVVDVIIKILELRSWLASWDNCR